MTLSSKKCIGITVFVIGVFVCSIDKNLKIQPKSKACEYRLYQVRKGINENLARLRQQRANDQFDVCSSTLLDIKKLWYSRDLFLHTLKKRMPRFPADSLANLEKIIDRKASLALISDEISRLEQLNDNE